MVLPDGPSPTSPPGLAPGGLFRCQHTEDSMPALTITAKMKDGSDQALDLERVALTGDETDLHGRRITSLLRSPGGDVEIVQYATHRGRNAAKRWTAQIVRIDRGGMFMVSSAVKTRRAILPDVRFYMSAHHSKGRALR